LLQSSEAFNELKFRLHQRLIEDLDPSKLDGEQSRAREIVEGAARAIISSEMPELLEMADRIVVMRSGRIVAELQGHRASQEELLRRAS
jgi:energy-coupling factor transporter ATP-binding protein EcfA2